MKFSDFLRAIRESWGLASVVSLLVTSLAGAGVGSLFGGLPPTIALMAMAMVAYVVGYAAACYKNAEERAKQSDAPPSVTLDDVRTAEVRTKALLEPEIESLRSERDELKDKVERLEKIVEAGERAVGNAYYADMMDDYEESGIGKVGASPVDAAGVVGAGEVENGEQLA